jgi:hypothetical protein
MRRLILVGTLFVTLATGAVPWAGEPQEAPVPAAPAAAAELTDAEKEAFLLEGHIVRRRSAPGGITSSVRATLRQGAFEHDAHIQAIDEYKGQTTTSGGTELDFRDCWRNNVAAYRLDRQLGLGMVPVTVVRRDEDTRLAAFTWWVDDVQMTERERLQKKVQSPDIEAWNQQIFVVRIFDQLIYNFDRNLGNLLIDKQWRVWMIDHTRAFKVFDTLKEEKNLSRICERHLLDRLRRLDRATLKTVMKDLLSDGQIDGLLKRRDRIAKFYEAKIAALGEGTVLYDLPRRLVDTTEKP